MPAPWLTYADPGAHRTAGGPDYFRDAFPYTLPPLVQFEPTPVPLDPPDAIWITDTTFRDGQQSRAPYTVDQIVTLYGLLQRLGGRAAWSARASSSFIHARTARPSSAVRSSATTSRR
jgi:hypothetical protein